MYIYLHFYIIPTLFAYILACHLHPFTFLLYFFGEYCIPNRKLLASLEVDFGNSVLDQVKSKGTKSTSPSSGCQTCYRIVIGLCTIASINSSNVGVKINFFYPTKNLYFKWLVNSISAEVCMEACARLTTLVRFALNKLNQP